MRLAKTVPPGPARVPFSGPPAAAAPCARGPASCDVRALLQRLYRGSKRRRGWLCVLLAGLLVDVIVFGFLDVGPLGPAAIHARSMVLAAWVGLYLAAGTQVLPDEARAVEALRRAADERAVGPLIGALERGDGHVRAAAKQALARALPRMVSAGAGLVRGRDATSLCRALADADPAEAAFALAVLAHLEQGGDPRHIPWVAQMARGETPLRQLPHVRRAARVCLAALQNRAARERARRTGLRPADPPGPAGGRFLLRPAAGGSAMAVRTLVRPV